MAHLKNLNYTSKFALSACALSFVAIVVFYLLIGVPILWTLGIAAGISAIGYFISLTQIDPKPTFGQLLLHEDVKLNRFIKGEQKLDFKFILESFKNCEADETCAYIYKHAQSEQILNRFAELSLKEKIELLTMRALKNDRGRDSLTVFSYLLWTDNTRMFRALFKGLSSKQRLELIWTKGNVFVYSINKLSPELLNIIFEDMTAEDRLTLLSHERRQGSGVSGLRDCLNLLSRDSAKQEITELVLRILVKGLRLEQLKPLLAYKGGLNNAQVWHYKPKNEKKEYTALEIVMLDQNAANVANLLIEYGALEADPECDFEILSKNPDINLTPYRNKLKAELKASKAFNIEGIDELVCDYLIGGRASKKAVSVS